MIEQRPVEAIQVAPSAIAIAPLTWIEGMPPIWTNREGTSTLERAWSRDMKPFVAQFKDGRTLVVGDINLNGGGCDCCMPEDTGRTDIVAYALINWM